MRQHSMRSGTGRWITMEETAMNSRLIRIAIFTVVFVLLFLWIDLRARPIFFGAFSVIYWKFLWDKWLTKRG